MKPRGFFVMISVGIVCAGADMAQAWLDPVPIWEVNSIHHENTPFLSYDEKTLYFTRAGTPEFYNHRLYQASRSNPNGHFTVVEELGSPMHHGSHVNRPWVSPDNLRMYYYATEAGNVGAMKLSERSSVDEPWPQGQNVLEINMQGDIRGLSLTEDELSIFFRAKIPGGEGGYDIWTASRASKDAAFSGFSNLYEMNTLFNEHDPFISPDGFTLYFSSDRNGPIRLFEATRDSLDEPFGPPGQLPFGDSPNVDISAPSLSADGTRLYFTHRVDGGQLDIYVSYIPEPATIAFLGLGAVALRRRRVRR